MKILISQEDIRERIAELAREISGHYQSTPLTIVGVLTGCLIFVADLVRYLEMPLRISFLQASSYRGETMSPGALRINPEMMLDLKDRHVLLLDDILDSGQTLEAVVRHIRECQPASVRVGVLLRKTGKQQITLEPDYCGFEIPDKFVVGYGLDYNDEYRNLPYIAELE